MVPLNAHIGSRLVLTYVRDDAGIPTGYIVVDIKDLGPRTKVHSLGPFVDDYVDRFGHTDAFVELLWKARSTSSTCDVFVGKLQPRPAHEMEWFWERIVYPAEPVRRLREILPKSSLKPPEPSV